MIKIQFPGRNRCEKEDPTLWVNDHHIAAEICQENNWYEHWLLEFIESRLCKNDATYFVDIGANTGNHSMYLLRNVKNLVAFAYEPMPEARVALKLNRSDLPPMQEDNLRIYDYALSNKAGIMQMGVPAGASNGGARIGSGKINVKVNVFDDVWPGNRRIDIMKIDVEGHEEEVILGAIRNIEYYKPEILVEIFEEHKRLRISSLLATFGYELKERYCHAPVYHFSTRKDIPVTYKRPL